MTENFCPIASQPSHVNALITPEFSWTYGDLDNRLHHVCHHLQIQGICAGSRVAFIAHPTPQVILLFFALFRLKAVACPLSFREPPHVIISRVHTLQALLIDPATLPLDASSPFHFFSTVDESCLATCLFTSGSTGTPKIAQHTLRNHFLSAQGTQEVLCLDDRTRWQLSLPLFHVGGLAILFRTFLHGGAVVLNHKSTTHLSLVPTQLMRLLQQEQPLPDYSCILLGGATIPPLLLKQAFERGLPIMTTYGMTEMSSMITVAKQPTTVHVGTPLPFREIQLSSSGEILVRGETLFIGYEGHPHHEGWFATKDLGRFTDEGHLEMLGRKDRLFISGGENIQPEEIERALCSLPGIVAAYVRSVPDPEFGHRPVAHLLDTTKKYTLASVQEALRDLLPAFKHPIALYPYFFNGKKLF